MRPARWISAAVAVAMTATAAMADPSFWRHEWPDTDFTQTSVDNWGDILSGGPPKDGIPAVNDPTFIPVGDEDRIGDSEPVITLELDGATPRAYPVRYLTWHEIVNDVVGGVPVAVTFCPLCNSGITFDRRVNGDILTFGVSGKLRNSDMVMYDRETQSWWQQAIGTGIVGANNGTKLVALPSWMESWGQFKERNPNAEVMDQPNYRRAYGRNPYVGYDGSKKPFLYNGEMPPHGVPALMRVVRVGDTAWTMERIRAEGVISEGGVVLSWSEGQSSALDAPTIGGGKEVGTVRVRDQAGKDLPHDVMFAFAFQAFWPDGTWRLGG